jgi:hypothetical protein
MARTRCADAVSTASWKVLWLFNRNSYALEYMLSN